MSGYRDFGDVMLSLFPDLARLIGALVAVLIVIRAIALLIRAARRAIERQRRIEDLDLAATRAMPLGDLVINPETERHAAYRASCLTEAIAWCGFCRDLTVVGDLGDCACPRACGASWCGALRHQAKAPGDSR